MKRSIKQLVKEGYGKIARQGTSCCPGSSCCGSNLAKDISKTVGYTDKEMNVVPKGSNLGLGCGNPVAIASLKNGETVLDLGSGAGFDAFLAAKKVGKRGRVIGVDMTPEMIARARELSGEYPDLSFKQALFDSLPVEDAIVDRVFSMEALYYALDPGAVIDEIFRVMKPGGCAEIIINFYRENSTTAGWADELGVPMHWLSGGEWEDLFRAGGFHPVEACRVLDPGGPGREEGFIPDPWCPTWPDRRDFYDQGSLWIRAAKPEAGGSRDSSSDDNGT